MVRRRLEEPLIRRVGQQAAESLRQIRSGEKSLEIEVDDRLIRRLKRMVTQLQAEDAKEEKKVRAVDTYFSQLQNTLGKAMKVFDHPAGKPVRLELQCSEGHTIEWTSPNRIPPSVILSKLKRLGWRLGRHPKCPEHNGHVHKVERTKMPDVKAPPPPLRSAPTPPVEASEAARMAKRFVMGGLETYFDDMKGCYKPGHSDATIAKNAGVSEDVVKRLRIEFYGDLKEPTEIEEFREEARKLEIELQELNETVQARSSALNKRLDDLHEKIDRIVRMNNWRN